MLILDQSLEESGPALRIAVAKRITPALPSSPESRKARASGLRCHSEPRRPSRRRTSAELGMQNVFGTRENLPGFARQKFAYQCTGLCNLAQAKMVVAAVFGADWANGLGLRLRDVVGPPAARWAAAMRLRAERVIARRRRAIANIEDADQPSTDLHPVRVERGSKLVDGSSAAGGPIPAYARRRAWRCRRGGAWRTAAHGAPAGRRAEPVWPFPPVARWAAALRARAESAHPLGRIGLAGSAGVPPATRWAPAMQPRAECTHPRGRDRLAPQTHGHALRPTICDCGTRGLRARQQAGGRLRGLLRLPAGDPGVRQAARMTNAAWGRVANRLPGAAAGR